MLRRTLAAVFAVAALVCPAAAQDAYLIGVTGAMTGPAAGTKVATVGVAELFGELSGIKPPAFKPPMFLLRFLIGRAEKKAQREIGVRQL